MYLPIRLKFLHMKSLLYDHMRTSGVQRHLEDTFLLSKDFINFEPSYTPGISGMEISER